uniref:Retrovirus-related Pol polyprotein from transposon TNT 1-94 n=1 Tax=Tanacetum cinerariifolium TaxID=118510 RepID=A0A6L2LR37_TANCI|nr:hypothetical protein [Tanacetum cinerariifolium]
MAKLSAAKVIKLAETTTYDASTSTTIIPGHVTIEEKAKKNNDVKARSMLLMALPNEHLMTFNQYKDDKTLFAAIETRFGGNEATKKTQKTLLKQQYEKFSATSTKSLDLIFNMLQKLVSQLAVLGVFFSQEDLNLKFVRSLPSEWNTHVKTKKKITINGSDTASYDKSKLECFNYHNLGNFIKECLVPRNQENRTMNQEITRRTVNVKDISSKEMVAIDGASFYWSYIANDEAPTNMVFIALSGSEQNQGDVNDALRYKKKVVVVTSDPLALVAKKLKKVKKKDDEKKRDISKVKCYNCKKEGHFSKDCKKAKVKAYNYYKTKMLLDKKESDEQVLLAEDQAWMESSNDSNQEINANMVFMAQIKKVILDSDENSSSTEETIAELLEMNNNVLRLQEKVLEKETKYSKLEGCVSNKDVEIEKCLERLNECENKLHKIKQTNQTIHMIIHSKDTLYNGRKGIGFENLSYFEKEKVLRPSLYDEKVTGLGYTPIFLIHSDEALEIEKFKRAIENKIEFAYDYRNLNEKINFLDDYFQEIINLDFEKIDSLFQQTSSLKPYVSTVILEKIIIDLEDEVMSLLEKEKANLKTIESLKSKGFESSENAISELENESENDCQVVEKECDQMENSKVIAPGMFKLSVSQSVLPISMSKTSCDYKNVENKSKRKRHLDTFSSVTRPKQSSVIWKKKGSSNTSNVDLSSIVQICLWIIDSGCSKHMTGNHVLLTNFVEKFLGTVRFGNNDFAVIAGYEDVVIGSMKKKKVYYSTCFVRYEDGVDLLTGDRSSNLYTIALNEVVSNSLTCLLERASSLQSWLWHQRLSHINFTTINNLVKNNLVQGLPKTKFEKDFLCSACEQGKIHRKHHKSKTTFASNKPLYLLHMDLCGLVHVESINGKRYVLVVVDDYSRYTWRVRTDNGTEFKNKTLTKFFDDVGITQQFSAARTLQQNGLVERRNRTLVEAARTMLTFANLPLFHWAEAIATACFIQNRSIIHKHFDKTPYELMNKRKPNIKFFCLFGCRCYLLNDYEGVGKLKAKGNIGVFVGCSKESVAFRIYNKRSRKIHERVNVNFDEISEMDSKQFGLEPGLSNLDETGKFSDPSVSQVSESSKKDLEDLFYNFYDEYFFSSKIMKSSIMNAKTSNVKIPSHEEEVFYESSESFQKESSLSSLNDDVQKSLKEVGVPLSNTQSILNNMIPNVDEASTSHIVFNERLEDAYFDASTSFHDPSNVHTFYQPYPHEKRWTKDHPLHKIIGDPKSCVRTRGFVSKQYPDHVYALDKALYGLKQTPWAWYDILSQFLIDSGFQKVPTPMVKQAKLKLDLVGKPVDHTDYRSMIGSLMYVTSSRPDIMFTTRMCARYQANPNEHHVLAVKRIFRYLKGTINLGLWYPKDSGFDLTAYSDADYAGCHLDQKTFILKELYWRMLMELQELSVQSYRVKPIEVVTQKSSVKISAPVKENNGAPHIKDWESDKKDEVESPPEANKGKVVKASACLVWRPIKLDRASIVLKKQNISYLTDFNKFDGGYVAFGGGAKGGKITDKRKIKTGKIDFKDMYFINELQFNLFSVSHMCDKKNSVLFSNIECFVLSPDFKLADESHVLLKVPKKNNMYNVDMKNIIPRRDLNCLGKQYKVSFKSNIQNSIYQPLFMLNMDLFSPTSMSSIMHKKYYLVIIDDFSRFTWVFFLATKDETSRILKSFIIEIENLVDKKVKLIRCDNGKELKNRVMNDFYEEKSIKMEYSVARTPSQNGVAERRNKTLIETPYELFRGRTHALSFMRPVRCHVTILNTLDHLGKFDGKSDEGFFVGYSTNSKAFRVYNTRTRKVEENLHIKFLENKPLITGDGRKWLFDIDTLIELMNYVPSIAGTTSNDFVGKGASFDAGQSSMETRPSQGYILMPLWNDGSVFDSSSKALDGDNQDNDVPNTKSEIDNQERPNVEHSTKDINNVGPSINTASLSFNIASLTVNIVRLSDDFFGADNDIKNHSLDNVIGDIQSGVQTRRMIVTTNEQGFICAIYEEKTHEDLHTCLFACFLSQEEPKRITNALKDLAWVEAMQEKLMQFILQKVWTLVDLPRGKRAIGTKWVFRKKKDEKGIVIRNKAKLVAQGCTQEEGIDYDEVFTPMAIIKAIRLFLAYASFMGFLVYQMDVKSAFLYGRIKEEVYVCQPPGFEDPGYPDKVYKVEKALYGLHQAPRSWYETLAKYLLDNGFHRGKIDQTLFIKRQKEDILLVQLHVDGIIFGSTKKDLCTKFEDDVKPPSTLMDKEKSLLKDSKGEDVDVHLYMSMIRSLMYLTSSKPHIMFDVYSNYDGASIDRKSTSGGCQFLGCRLISWQYKKQTVVATYITEAECVAPASCCGLVLWIQNQLLDYRISTVSC